jgi:plastocyanin
MKRTTATATAAALVVVAILGALLVMTTGVSNAATADNSIKDYAFTPADLTVKTGDTVTWTNGDKAPHTVTSTSGKGPLDSPNLQTGDKYSYTFTSAGTYQYYCAIHPDMLGSVTVVAESAPPPPSSTTTTTMGMDHGAHGAPTTTTTVPPSTPAKQPESACSAGLFDAMLTPFVIHFDKAHLETSPGQQVSDATNVDQYTKTHTMLIEAMWTPLTGLLLGAPDGLVPFIVHFNKAHLETSPGQQVSDATNVDQYTKTHTILIENMLAPSTNSLAGTC